MHLGKQENCSCLNGRDKNEGKLVGYPMQYFQLGIAAHDFNPSPEESEVVQTGLQSKFQGCGGLLHSETLSQSKQTNKDK